MLLLCGIPLFCAELALGQYSGKGTLAVWKAVPGFKGIGFGMIIVSRLGETLSKNYVI
jgi:SNF family Na+-dependent transporter